jgi:hypothetical protein
MGRSTVASILSWVELGKWDSRSVCKELGKTPGYRGRASKVGKIESDLGFLGRRCIERGNGAWWGCIERGVPVFKCSFLVGLICSFYFVYFEARDIPYGWMVGWMVTEPIFHRYPLLRNIGGIAGS